MSFDLIFLEIQSFKFLCQMAPTGCNQVLFMKQLQNPKNKASHSFKSSTSSSTFSAFINVRFFIVYTFRLSVYNAQKQIILNDPEGELN
jgi:hypothetical protein